MDTPSQPPGDTTAIETKLAAARARLILDKPFLGALVLRLPLRAAPASWCPTTATDARAFYYNPDYIAQLSLAETQFMLAHEALHCALSHFARRQHRGKHRWDLACDYAINPLLIDDGLTPPPNTLVMPLFNGLTAEEIYPLIEDNDPSQTLDTHAYDREDRSRGRRESRDEHDLARQRPPAPPPATKGTSGHESARQPSPSDAGQHAPQAEQSADTASAAQAPPAPLTPDERDTLSVQWRQRLAGAAQQAARAGKFGGELRRLVDHLLQPGLPWRMLLARYMSTLARDDYSYTRPSRREGDFVRPSPRGAQLELVVAIDTSGSIKDDEMQQFIDEIDALKGQARARVTLLPCDAALCPDAPFRFEPWEEFQRPARLQGGGGTRFTPVFDWIDTSATRPDLLLYFTDAEGEFPLTEPPYPVIWLVKGRAPVPWGQRIQLN